MLDLAAHEAERRFLMGAVGRCCCSLLHVVVALVFVFDLMMLMVEANIVPRLMQVRFRAIPPKKLKLDYQMLWNNHHRVCINCEIDTTGGFRNVAPDLKSLTLQYGPI